MYAGKPSRNSITNCRQNSSIGSRNDLDRASPGKNGDNVNANPSGKEVLRMHADAADRWENGMEGEGLQTELI